MTTQPLPPRQQILDGTVRIFIADGLMLPTGLLTVAFLTRSLGPEVYGLYSLAAVIVSWLTWTVTSIYARSAIKFVSEAPNWQTVGSFVLRLSLVAGCGTTLMVVLLAPVISNLLGAAKLTGYLQLFAIEIVFVCLANSHKGLDHRFGQSRDMGSKIIFRKTSFLRDSSTKSC